MPSRFNTITPTWSFTSHHHHYIAPVLSCPQALVNHLAQNGVELANNALDQFGQNSVALVKGAQVRGVRCDVMSSWQRIP
jgi:hypothetical protein